jgi:predicted small secreted protein
MLAANNAAKHYNAPPSETVPAGSARNTPAGCGVHRMAATRAAGSDAARGETDMTHRIRVLFFLALGVISLGLAACNTVEGAGKDVKSAGNAIEDTANDAKQNMNN